MGGPNFYVMGNPMKQTLQSLKTGVTSETGLDLLVNFGSNLIKDGVTRVVNGI